MYIEGCIRTRKSRGKDGQERYTTEIEAMELQMLGSRSDEARFEKPNARDPLVVVNAI